MQVEVCRNRVPNYLRRCGRVIFALEKVASLATAAYGEATLLQGSAPQLGQADIVQDRGSKIRFPVVSELSIRSEHRAEVVRPVPVRQQVLRVGVIRELFRVPYHSCVRRGQIRELEIDG